MTTGETVHELAGDQESLVQRRGSPSGVWVHGPGKIIDWARFQSVLDPAGQFGQGECVELAPLDDGTVAVRNSHHPTAGTVYLTRTEMNAWLQSVKTGDLDDLT